MTKNGRNTETKNKTGCSLGVSRDVEKKLSQKREGEMFTTFLESNIQEQMGQILTFGCESFFTPSKLATENPTMHDYHRYRNETQEV